MGCAPSKDKPEAKGEESAPAEKPIAAAPAKATAAAAPAAASAARKDGSHDFLSEDLKALMSDYFNRYDLDGSKTINSSEELKQLCTNLVVKLDLDMDVSDIDKVVGGAGAFADDQNSPDGEGNNWSLQEFTSWFCAKGHFDVNRSWQAGDMSDEEEEPSDDKPFLTGTYIGKLEGGGKKYQQTKHVGGKIDAKTKELVGFEIKDTDEFTFVIRPDPDKEGSLMERPGCDSCGMFNTSGSIDGKAITMIIEYFDLDNDSSTPEPKLVLKGEWCGAEDKYTIKGTWSNENAEKAGEQMKYLGLEGVQDGTFELTKRIRDEGA